ncbi:AraC family transcriptional regulator [Paenibacillus sp. NEAU-GSW1]|uniref:helix-turn-helix transcriptional regulator n=1 Tax=Paenibacillus sp. NEAU-GSW1 TaxID=2682486 RepID=UPI0012E1BC7D|nr:AraC family transcriptional regulator [Paenibacillus sp. NEAU-GSW1]MUT66901.1 AraC family transcriptional regulator [Paenibacillus sp. NEAU-GSW1]
MRTHYYLPEPAITKYICYPESFGRYSEFPQHREHRPEGMMDYYNLHLVFSGQGYVEHERGRTILQAGDGFLYSRKAEQRYGTDPDLPWDVRWIHFKAAAGLPLVAGEGNQGLKLFTSADLERCAQVMNAMYKLCEPFETREEPRMSALLYEVLAELAHNAEPLEQYAISREKKESIRVAADQILSRCGEPWTLAAMAELSGYSTYYFVRIFQTIIGKTPNQYLTDCRIAAAKSLLITSRMTIGQVAERVGFSQASYFIRVFRREAGFSPKAYRELFG